MTYIKEDLVPTLSDLFVVTDPHFDDLVKVIESKEFYPIFISGLSGNGKTLSVEQACARTERPLIRVNITIETDEDDLLGGFRLVNGETQWNDGPVIQAMRLGAVLLLDEVDLASTKILCLQPILEGGGILLKKINEYVKPAKGFNIISTANTKGQGSENGKFIGTNVLNEAFLERFPVTLQQNYPSSEFEKDILEKVYVDLVGSANDEVKDFISYLVQWADQTRKTYFADASTELISTRRLVHIIKAYAVLKSKVKALNFCTNRFDSETQANFIHLFDKIDPTYTTKNDLDDESEFNLVDSEDEESLDEVASDISKILKS